MLFPLKVIRCLSAMEYVNIPAEETAFKNETLCLTLLWKLKTEMKLFLYGRGEVSLSINLPSHRFLQHSPEVSITFMVVVVCSIRHLRQICNWTARFIIRFATSSPETRFPVNSRPTGSDKLLSNEVIISQLTSVTKDPFKVAGSGDGVDSTYSRSTGNSRPTNSLIRVSNWRPGLMLIPSVAKQTGITRSFGLSINGWTPLSSNWASNK